MARFRWALGIAAVALASSQASADLRAPANVDRSVVVTDSASLDSVDLSRETLFHQRRTGLLAGPDLVAEMALEPPVSSAPVSVDYHPAVIELPPAPGSAALFLSAMVSLGAWQLVRSSRDLHLGAMPEWYHPGGPAQIGHTTVFDLEFSAVALCVFDAPTPAPVFSNRLARESRPRCFDQHVLSQADPRGPPAQAS